MAIYERQLCIIFMALCSSLARFRVTCLFKCQPTIRTCIISLKVLSKYVVKIFAVVFWFGINEWGRKVALCEDDMWFI